MARLPAVPIRISISTAEPLSVLARTTVSVPTVSNQSRPTPRVPLLTKSWCPASDSLASMPEERMSSPFPLLATLPPESKAGTPAAARIRSGAAGVELSENS